MESSFFMFRLGETWVVFRLDKLFKGKHSLFYIYLSYSELPEIEIYEMLSFIGFFFTAIVFPPNASLK